MENKKRLIYADALKAKANADPDSGEGFVWVQDIDEAPTVDAVPVVHGRWLGKQLDNFRMYQVTCSECGWEGIENYDSYVDPSDFNYCPNCGAKMDLEVE